MNGAVIIGRRCVRRLRFVVALAGLAVLAVACGDGSGFGGWGYGAPAGSAPATLRTATAPGFGSILVDGQGRSVYLFANNTGATSTCAGGCASAWPPVTGTAASGAGTTPGLVATIRRADGVEQVTYGGHPLYYYVGDREPGDARGHGRDQFGAAWYLLDPQGKQLDDAS